MPYLEIDEAAAYIKVISDGYIFYVQIDDNYNFNPYMNPSETVLGREFVSLYHNNGTDGNLTYSFCKDDNKEVEIIENGPNRVVIRLTGNFYNASDTQSPVGFIAGLDKVTIEYTFYPDYFIKRIVLEVGTTFTLLDSTSYSNALTASYMNDAGGYDAYYESSGTEVAGGEGNYNSAKYLFTKCSGLYAVQQIVLSHTEAGTASFDQRIEGGTMTLIRWNNGTLTVGTHEAVIAVVIDSASREAEQGSWATSTEYDAGDMVANDGIRYRCHTDHTSSSSDEPGTGANWEDYWDEFRLQVATELLDQTIGTPDKGTWVTDYYD